MIGSIATGGVSDRGKVKNEEFSGLILVGLPRDNHRTDEVNPFMDDADVKIYIMNFPYITVYCECWLTEIGHMYCSLNKVCASGMNAVKLGGQFIRGGDMDVVIAGGMGIRLYPMCQDTCPEIRHPMVKRECRMVFFQMVSVLMSIEG